MSEWRAIPVSRALLSTLAASACGGPAPLPPAPAPPDAPTFVSATFDLAWNASVDHFDAYNIPVASIDRDAGEIATERLPVAPEDAMEFADCGTVPGASPEPILATSVAYHVKVRDEGRSSTVLVAASWDTSDPSAPFPCQSTGVQEGEMQEAIKLAAEVNR